MASANSKPCPGSKIKSQGRGKGLGKGKGKGPLGTPSKADARNIKKR